MAAVAAANIPGASLGGSISSDTNNGISKLKDDVNNRGNSESGDDKPLSAEENKKLLPVDSIYKLDVKALSTSQTDPS